ncbi:YajG family lipoprotein, partial [Erwinia amylovora]|uniref:YajG family lipoprotein n=1 Tax=Erwinia amylovora TaxID=552 RepID=UPI0020BDEE53
YTLVVSRKIQLPQRDPALFATTVSINGAVSRRVQALAKVNRDGKLVSLTPSRDLGFLLQETLEKQLTALGYMVGPAGAVDQHID